MNTPIELEVPWIEYLCVLHNMSVPSGNLSGWLRIECCLCNQRNQCKDIEYLFFPSIFSLHVIYFCN